MQGSATARRTRTVRPGIVAGTGMAFIAMIADRMTQGLSRAYQERIGFRAGK